MKYMRDETLILVAYTELVGSTSLPRSYLVLSVPFHIIRVYQL